MEKGKQTILQGALILTASTMVVKVRVVRVDV